MERLVSDATTVHDTIRPAGIKSWWAELVLGSRSVDLECAKVSLTALFRSWNCMREHDLPLLRDDATLPCGGTEHLRPRDARDELHLSASASAAADDLQRHDASADRGGLSSSWLLAKSSVLVSCVRRGFSHLDVSLVQRAPSTPAVQTTFQTPNNAVTVQYFRVQRARRTYSCRQLA